MADLDPFFFTINSWSFTKHRVWNWCQRHVSNRYERDKADDREFSHGAVRLTRGIPVRDYLIGEHRVRGGRDEEGEEEAGEDCQPDEVHAGRWVSMGNEDGEVAGAGVSRNGLGLG